MNLALPQGQRHVKPSEVVLWEASEMALRAGGEEPSPGNRSPLPSVASLLYEVGCQRLAFAP